MGWGGQQVKWKLDIKTAQDQHEIKSAICPLMTEVSLAERDQLAIKSKASNPKNSGISKAKSVFPAKSSPRF